MALCYSMAMGLNKGYKVNKNVSEPPQASHKAHQVHAGHDLRSV